MSHSATPREPWSQQPPQQPYGAPPPGYPPQQPGHQQPVPPAYGGQPAFGTTAPQGYAAPGQPLGGPAPQNYGGQGVPPAGATPPRSPRRGPWLLWLLLALGLILALLLGGLAYNALKPAQSTTAPIPSQAASTAPATTAKPTSAPATSGSASSRPSSASAAPSSASASRSSASGSPSANVSAHDYAQQKYGTFDPQTITGQGDKVIQLPDGVKAGLVTAENTDNSIGFTVNTQTADGGMDELLFNAEHFSKGTRTFGVIMTEPAKSIKVRCSGAWKLTIAPVASAPAQKPPASGHGDTVFLYDGPGGNWTFSHTGAENFIVSQAGPGVVDPILVNKTGRYSGQQQVKSGPRIIQVVADGDWEIKS